jgi:hypothetical protein
MTAHYTVFPLGRRFAAPPTLNLASIAGQIGLTATVA